MVSVLCIVCGVSPIWCVSSLLSSVLVDVYGMFGVCCVCCCVGVVSCIMCGVCGGSFVWDACVL